MSGGGGGGQWGGRGRGTGARRRVFARASRAPVAPCSVTRLAARGSGRREGLQAAAPPPLVAGARPREGCGARRGARPGLSPLPAPPVPPGPAGSCRNFASYRRCAPRGPARGCHGVTEGAVAELLPRCRDGTADHGKATGPRVPDGEATSDAFGAGRVRGCCGRHPCGHWGSREGFREPAMAPAVLGINTFVFVSVGRRCVSPSSFSLSAGERLPVVPEA